MRIVFVLRYSMPLQKTGKLKSAEAESMSAALWQWFVEKRAENATASGSMAPEDKKGASSQVDTADQMIQADMVIAEPLSSAAATVSHVGSSEESSDESGDEDDRLRSAVLQKLAELNRSQAWFATCIGISPGKRSALNPGTFQVS
jgi:hypothetical protein